MGREVGGGGSGLGTHVHPWWIHVNVMQNQYSIVKENKVKIKMKKFKKFKKKECSFNMPANLENSTVATRLEKVSFHFNSEEGQCQRMFKLPDNYTHFAC